MRGVLGWTLPPSQKNKKKIRTMRHHRVLQLKPCNVQFTVHVKTMCKFTVQRDGEPLAPFSSGSSDCLLYARDRLLPDAYLSNLMTTETRE